ncbi:MAG: PKD domain-containing protein [Bacteroidetes bacterium]|nr:MAG: PKD domain-containing protein [Bacteroidota bacterium]
MNVKWSILILIAVFLNFELNAQNSNSCTTLGQTPGTAFPVCGTTNFVQSNVPLCYTHTIYVPGCTGGNADYSDLNPFWYKFTCYQSGTLGFVISPNNLNDDYDWQLFDITGHNPTDVFTDTSLFVSGNWSGSSGLTGASSSGTANIECASDPMIAYEQTFSRMPTLIQGHNYLLLVSHFTISQSGYTLSFGGGTASIVDPLLPHLGAASPFCDGSKLGIKLNKKMSCASLAPDGSDFRILTPLAKVISAASISCSSGFDMDSVILMLSNPLPPGNYAVSTQNGTDGNTLLDNCGNGVPVGEQVAFTLAAVTPTLLDSIAPLTCRPGELQLIFKKPIQCSTIAADGSDFVISGPAPINIISAAGQCDADNNSSIIHLKLSAPIDVGGLYEIKVASGTDGNSIIDECGQVTPVGNSLDFAVADTVSAAFTYQLLYGCQFDTLVFRSGTSGINSWNWSFDGMPGSNQQNPQVIYSDYGLKKVQLIVSNGICSDTASNAINLDNQLKAGFGATAILCPEDLAVIVNSSVGKIASWNWNFGDGSHFNDSTPSPHQYPPPQTVQKIYTVTLTVTDSLGCVDTAMRDIKVVRSCYITVPNAFTPNGDGINDYLYPLNAYKALNLEFRVYNRYGQLVFETTDWTKKWDGTINGKPQQTDTFVWTLHYTDGDTGKRISLKGTSTLIR